MATKFKADDQVTVIDKDHPRNGQKCVIQSVPTKVDERDEQRYDCQTPDQKHSFSAIEKQLTSV